VAVFVDEDPEIADDRHIILDVDVTGLDADQMYTGVHASINRR
jgi:hypothetical protein